MILNSFTLLIALSLSFIAIYYSVAGLTAIFAASVIPVIIMGTILELAKLITALWLHWYWRRAVWWLKTYLSVALVVLMIITSMGIYGFLSKSHIEQTAASDENQAKLDQINVKIAQQQSIIDRAKEQISQLETATGGVDSGIQKQIDREQERINTAYTRVEPAIKMQQQIIDSDNARIQEQVKPYLDQIAIIDSTLSELQSALSSQDTRKIQSIIGARVDGNYGRGTAEQVNAFREKEQAKKNELLIKVSEIKNSSTMRQQAESQIISLRQQAQKEIEDSNKLISRLREKLGTQTAEDIDKIYKEQQQKMSVASTELEKLNQSKIEIEVVTRKLEAEVGPIKYVAALIYGNEVDRNLLEDAVRWVIILIIIVFDPLAVLLLIASQYAIEYRREDKEKLALEKASNSQMVVFEETPSKPEPEIIQEVQEEIVDEVIEPEPEVVQPEVQEEIIEPEPEIIEPEVQEEIIESEPEVIEPEVQEEIIESEPEVQEEIIEPEIEEITEQLEEPPEEIFIDDFEIEEDTSLADYLKSIAGELSEWNDKQIDFGPVFPPEPEDNELFLKTNTMPTELYFYDNSHWEVLDKDKYPVGAYSDEYIRVLIDRLATNLYNPELLAEVEKQKIESFLNQNRAEGNNAA